MARLWRSARGAWADLSRRGRQVVVLVACLPFIALGALLEIVDPPDPAPREEREPLGWWDECASLIENYEAFGSEADDLAALRNAGYELESAQLTNIAKCANAGY